MLRRRASFARMGSFQDPVGYQTHTGQFWLGPHAFTLDRPLGLIFMPDQARRLVNRPEFVPKPDIFSAALDLCCALLYNKFRVMPQLSQLRCYLSPEPDPARAPGVRGREVCPSESLLPSLLIAALLPALALKNGFSRLGPSVLGRLLPPGSGVAALLADADALSASLPTLPRAGRS